MFKRARTLFQGFPEPRSRPRTRSPGSASPEGSRGAAAHRRGEDFDPLKYATEETVVLSPIPCWEHLPAEKYRDRIRGLVTTTAIGGLGTSVKQHYLL